MDSHLKAVNYNRLFYLFLWIHISVWTLVPLCIRYTLPMDSVEAAIWGHQFQWGYDKNPFLNGWLTALAIRISGRSGWGFYLFSQLSVGVCFWSVWRLAKKILPDAYALLAVVLLEGVQYYNFHAIDFNDNTLELSLWGLTALYFYQALKGQSRRDWMLTGLFAGLGMMAKYYTVMLLFPMALFLIANRDNRASFKIPAFYWGAGTFLMVLTPHTIWLFFHDFITVNYALERVHTHTNSWVNHVKYSSQFVLDQFAAFAPCLLLALLLLIGQKNPNPQFTFALKPFDKSFLLYVGTGPFLATIVLSMVTGIALRGGWGEPLLSLWGIILIASLRPHLNWLGLKCFSSVYGILFCTIIISYSVALTRAAEPSSANFPGKIIAKTLTHEWHAAYHAPLRYVAGSRWIAGNVALYSKDKPAVYIEWDPKHSPWIDEAKLRKQGAIFAWENAEEDNNKLAEIFSHYSHLSPTRVLHFSWLRNKKMEPVEISVAFLAPEADV